MREGHFTLLELPRADPGGAQRPGLLRVEAEVRRGGACKAMYMTYLKIAGQLLELPNYPGSLEFWTSGHEFNVDADRYHRLRVGNRTVRSVAEFEELVPPGIVEVAQRAESHAPMVRKRGTQRTRTLAIKLSLPSGPALTVSFMHTAQRGHRSVNHLDFAAEKLGRAGLEVGGILGLDDHTLAATPPEICEDHQAKTDKSAFIGTSHGSHGSHELAKGMQRVWGPRAVRVTVGGSAFPSGTLARYD